MRYFIWKSVLYFQKWERCMANLLLIAPTNLYLLEDIASQWIIGNHKPCVQELSRGRSNESSSYHLTSHGKTQTFLHQDPFEGEHGGRSVLLVSARIHRSSTNLQKLSRVNNFYCLGVKHEIRK